MKKPRSKSKSSKDSAPSEPNLVNFSEKNSIQPEEKVKPKEGHLRAVLERISDAFVALDSKWCYTYMNKSAGRIFDRDPEAMVGKHIWTEFPEGIDQPFYKAYYKAMEEQKYIQLEEYYPPYDRWFVNHIYPSPEGLSIYFNDITERKKNEERMRINEIRLMKSQEMGELGYWELESHSDKIWGSSKALEIFGLPVDSPEIPIEKIEACIPEIDIVRKAALELIQQGKKYNIEIRIRPADGSPPKDISAIGEIDNDMHGKAFKIMGVINDVTEKKRQERIHSLEKEALEFYTSQNSTVEDLITFLLNGIRNIHPDMLCSVLKVRDGRLYNWSSPHLPEAYNELVEGTEVKIGKGSCGSASFLRKKVEVSDISTDPYWEEYRDIATKFDLQACWSYPIIDSKQNLLGSFGIYHRTKRKLTKAEELSIDRVRIILVNVIEKKLAENAARNYKEQLELIFNTSKDVIFLLSLENKDCYKFVTVNQPFLLATGLEKEEVEGKNVEEVIAEPSRSLVLSKYKEAIRTGKTIFWDETTEYPSGKKTGIVTISPVFDENNVCVKLLGTVHDITDRKESEEALKHAIEELRCRNEELKEKNLRLEDIAWIQSHKVRAPLARIMGLIDLITNHYDQEMNQEELLKYIISSAKELDKIIMEIVKKTEKIN